ncbi:MAG: LysR family transcriptional regulator [Nitrospinota bacterium]
MLNQVTIHQLELFLIAAGLKNFSRAAEQMSISQPAFSAQIIKLEQVLGVPLFDRVGRRIELTKAGVIFEEYARMTISTLSEGKQAIDDISNKFVGRLQLGASTTVASYMLTNGISEYKRTYPVGKVRMLVGNTNQIEQHLLKNEIDIGIVEGPVENKRLKLYAYRDDELVVICSPSHKWSKRKSVTLTELKKEPIIVREWGSGTRRVFMDALGPACDDLNINMELGGTEAIKNAVIDNIGVAVLSRATVEVELKNGTICSTYVENYPFKRQINIILLKSRYISHPVRYFMKILKPLDPLPE